MARPEATWLALRTTVRRPNRAERARPAAGPGRRAHQRRAGLHRHREAGGRAQHHHALDAEVEHAGALGDEFAERRDHQRRGGGDDGDEHHLEDVEAHAAAPGTRRTR